MTATKDMDQLDILAASAFEGYLVRKDLVRKYARQYPVPTYVVEFMLGRYCASTDPAEIAEGLEIVEKQLQGRTVRTGDEELFKSRAREAGSVKLIDIVRAKLDAKNDCYVAELPSLDAQSWALAGLLRSAPIVCPADRDAHQRRALSRPAMARLNDQYIPTSFVSPTRPENGRRVLRR
jgi:ATP-dependent Lon protease